LDEFDLIDRFFRRQRVQREDVALGIGDDAAVVRAPADGRLVVTTDVLVGGVHFPAHTGPSDIGYKALAVNLSDIAAMGASPAWATLGLTLPDPDESWLEHFASGFLALAERHCVQLVGGDLTGGPLCIAVQLTGIVGTSGYLSRGGARDGDEIYVSGTVGDAALGLQVVDGTLRVSEQDGAYLRGRLNRPVPRVELGRALAGRASAAIDVSDGLVADLGHLCNSSRVGASLEVDALPLSPAYRRALPGVGWEAALTFGDDYELCFTVPLGYVDDVERISRELDLPLTRIGRVGGDKVTWTMEGEPLSLSEHGYQHFRK
jgi:thiamine-monophosphate kinase